VTSSVLVLVLGILIELGILVRHYFCCLLLGARRARLDSQIYLYIVYAGENHPRLGGPFAHGVFFVSIHFLSVSFLFQHRTLSL